jgi:positive regulator of sigma E activity
MRERVKSAFMKLVFISLANIAVLYLVNIIAIYFAYAPSTVLVYILAGAVVSFVVATLYDRIVGKKMTPVEVELEALKQLVFTRYNFTKEDFEEERKEVAEEDKKK